MEKLKLTLFSFIAAVIISLGTAFAADSIAEASTESETCYTCAASDNTCFEVWIIKAQGNLLVGPCDVIIK